MNKKFIRTSIIIALPIMMVTFLLKVISPDINDIDNYIDNTEEVVIKEVETSQDENYYNISVTVENDSKDILSFNDINLEIMPLIERDKESDIIIKRSYDIHEDFEKQGIGIDPGESEEIKFKISKGISLDKEKFNLDEVKLNYNATFYKFRRGNSLFMGVRSIGIEQMVEVEF